MTHEMKTYVVLGHGTLALIDLDEHAGLVVRVGGEGLRLLGGDGGVALNQGRHHTARRLNAHREGRHVQQQEILHGLRLVAREDSGLDCRTIRHGLIRVNALVQLFTVETVLKQQRKNTLHQTNRNKQDKKNQTMKNICTPPPFENHPLQPIGFVYSPLWKIPI